MSPVRIHGDPFGEDAAASRARSFLRLAEDSGMQCALSLSGVRARPVAPGEAEIRLTDGVADFRLGTRLPPPEIEMLLRAADNAVPATAAVVVFAEQAAMDDTRRLAALEWSSACVVLPAHESNTAAELLQHVRAELRWAGVEHPPHALDAAELRPWFDLPVTLAGNYIVHVGSTDPAEGTDLVLAAWRTSIAASGLGLRLVLPDTADEAIARIESELAAVAGNWQIERAPFTPAHVADAAAILLPWRSMRCSSTLVKALASGRPTCVSRWRETAALIDRPGACATIGGAHAGGLFEPRFDAMVTALHAAVAEGAAAIGQRGRRHVVERLLRACPAPPAPSIPAVCGVHRPTVVLEAPFFETSSSAELSIETSRALLQRGDVDLRLVATVPFATGIAELRRRAPELEAHLVRQPGPVDLWLSTGWPVRASRPDCGTFGLRVDWEYGSLPVELTPHVTSEADVVVVHSEHVRRAVEAAGRPGPSIEVVPHGVDSAFHDEIVPDPEIVRWKGDRPAVVFCGGMVWRKGFDVFLRAVLSARAAGADFVVVIKSVGQERHYSRFNLRALVDRFVATPGTPPLLLVDRDLSRPELAALYRACDLMLHPYRGEGFCMPVLEARAIGLPVIATAGGATDGMMTGAGATRIPARVRELELPGAHLATPWVLEPCPDATARLLREALAELPARSPAARAHAASLRAAFSWPRAAAAIERLAEVAMTRRRRAGTAAEPDRIVVLPAAERNPAARVEPLLARRNQLAID